MKTQSRAAFLLALFTLATLATLALYRGPSRVWGDEGTFLAMMASLAHDGDLWFEEADLARVEAAEGGRRHLILERSGERIAYSKPIVFALVAAPFWIVFGDWGPIVLNVLALAWALALIFVYLRRFGDSAAAALLTVTFAGGGVLVPYLSWRMSDVFQTSLAVTGLLLCFARYRGTTPERPGALDRLLVWRGGPLVAAVLLGITVNMRVSNGVLVAAVVAAELVHRRLGRAAVVGALAVATFTACAGATLALTGTTNPYRMTRATFTPATGYPAGPEAETALGRLVSGEASDKTQLDTYTAPDRIAYAAFYLFAGRHSGLLFYFPAAIVLLLFALRRSDRVGWAALGALGSAFVFFVAWRADNYFGGDTFIGNRYFPVALPAGPSRPDPAPRTAMDRGRLVPRRALLRLGAGVGRPPPRARQDQSEPHPGRDLPPPAL